eukprot:SAG11_NODE_39411_length_232_cov_158.270677_1_plen_61_part_10
MTTDLLCIVTEIPEDEPTAEDEPTTVALEIKGGVTYEDKRRLDVWMVTQPVLAQHLGLTRG